MLEFLLIGTRKNLLRGLRRVFIVVTSLAVICTILMQLLVGYWKHHWLKEEARVIYEINTPMMDSRTLDLHFERQ